MEPLNAPVVELPISRTAAFTRGVLWLVTAALAALAAYAVYSQLRFVPSAISNRLVDYSIAMLALPLPIFALVTLFRALRWIALALWTNAGIRADRTGLLFSLGPFGRKTFDASKIEVRYPFELLDQPGYEAGVEAYLPEEEQIATLLPRVRDLATGESLGDLILKFVGEDELTLARKLSPVLMIWRSRHASSGPTMDERPCP